MQRDLLFQAILVSIMRLIHVLRSHLLRRSLSSARNHEYCQKPLDKFTVKMKPFAQLQLESRMPVWIKPLDHHEYPHMDHFILSLWSTETSDNDLRTAYDVVIDELENGLKVDAKLVKPAPFFCDIHLPLNADLDLVLHSDVEVGGMESNILNIVQNKGKCRFRRLKCGEVNVHSKEGDVVSWRGLHGNVKLKLENGKFTAERIQGQNVEIECAGDVDVEDLYAVTTSITASSNVSLRSSHGDTNVNIDKGSLTVRALDGCMTANVKEGNTDIHFLRHKNLDVTGLDGNVSLTTDQPNGSIVELSGREVDVAPELSLNDEKREKTGDVVTVRGTLRHETESRIRASAPQGTVSLSFKEWMTDFKRK